jgi:heme oxygenase (biliverdin-IX-beta and delta-forming)
VTSGSPQSGALLAHLRTVTRPAHDALEASLGLADDLNIASYRKVLARFYGFWVGWQPQVADLLQDEALLQPRRRLHLLAADLATLGVSPEDRGALPVCPLVPLRNGVEALGSLYVLEGSSLGGRIIERNVERCLGNTGRESCTYFRGYGAETGAMWRVLLLRLDAVPAAQIEGVGKGAVATFERMGWWLTTP